MQNKTTKFRWYQSAATIFASDIMTVAAFCAIGLQITINVILGFLDLGILIESYNGF
jgi:hypothetical protein